MKDELMGLFMRVLTAIRRAKLYVFELCLYNKIVYCKRAKIKKKLEREQKLFKSHKHNVFTICRKKVALNSNDDKRYLIKKTLQIP